jgi:hypothetical protein
VDLRSGRVMEAEGEGAGSRGGALWSSRSSVGSRDSRVLTGRRGGEAEPRVGLSEREKSDGVGRERTQREATGRAALGEVRRARARQGQQREGPATTVEGPATAAEGAAQRRVTTAVARLGRDRQKQSRQAETSKARKQRQRLGEWVSTATGGRNWGLPSAAEIEKEGGKERKGSANFH